MSTNTNPTRSDEKHSFDEFKAIVEALQPYFSGAKTGDGDHIRTAFFDHAHIVGSMNGSFIAMDADAFKDVVNENAASPDVDYQIAWIDMSGPAAAVKVEFIDWLGSRFTDFLVLNKHAAKWKISAKVYDAHSNN